MKQKLHVGVIIREYQERDDRFFSETFSVTEKSDSLPMSQNKQDWDVRLPVYTANFMFNTASRCLPSLFSPTGDCVGVWAVVAEEEAFPRGDLSLVRLQELQQVERQMLFLDRLKTTV